MAYQKDDSADVETFRLRNFINLLEQHDEIERVSEAVPLSHVAARLDGNPKAVLFDHAADGSMPLVGNVLGSRKRLALAFGVEESKAVPEMMRRLQKNIPPVEVSKTKAPVQQVVWTGEDADFTKLPAHLQHEFDGAPYISATLDFARDETNGFTNMGIRRIMLRGRREAGIDMIAPSDLRVIYARAHQRGEKMPLAFTVGFHPLDAIAALTVTPPTDEFDIAGALRGSPMPVVKAVTQDLFVPADAEIVLEGYLDEGGWRAPEGPFGEYVGYYGKLKHNPVFHLTAITMRNDAVFQTATIGGRFMAQTDTAQLAALRTEGAVWAALQQAVREPISVYTTASSGGMYNVRISIRQRVPGEARNAIAAVMGSIADVKHVFVMDPDIDIFSHDQFDWAFATRFQADRDLVVASGFRAVPLDPSLDGARSGGKAGFDLTIPFGKADDQDWTIPAPPVFHQAPRRSVRQALEEGPCYFRELMEAAGSNDGREIVRELEQLGTEISIVRLDDGRYSISP